MLKNLVLVAVLALRVMLSSAQAAEPVTARIDGHMLTLAFPADTLHESVWLQLDGHDVPARLWRGRRAPVRWASPTEVSVDLHRVKRRIGIKWANTVRIWGQQRDSASLLQTVELPGKKAAAAECCK